MSVRPKWVNYDFTACDGCHGEIEGLAVRFDKVVEGSSTITLCAGCVQSAALIALKKPAPRATRKKAPK